MPAYIQVLLPNLIHYQFKLKISPAVASIRAVAKILHLLRCTRNDAVQGSNSGAEGSYFLFTG